MGSSPEECESSPHRWTVTSDMNLEDDFRDRGLQCYLITKLEPATGESQRTLEHHVEVPLRSVTVPTDPSPGLLAQTLGTKEYLGSF